jgi:MinD-like ATPase involved in chromosome partitioning or flagellar assembly
MEQVSMNDGLDGRETIAFGLAAGEVATFVLALLSAYAVLRTGLPGAIGWLLAAILAAAGALLAWGRLAGRPLLEWTTLLAAFLVRTGPARAAHLRQRLQRCSAPWRALAADARLRVLPRVGAAAPGQAGAVVIPLALRRPPALTARGANAPARPTRSGSHVVGFFSLAGGTGRTTLAVEVAAALAVRGRAAGDGGNLVLLIDLACRNPAVGLRLGLAPPTDPDCGLATHDTGLLVAVAPATASPSGQTPTFPSALIDSARADVVLVDFDCDLGEGCHDILASCDQLLVTTTPTAAGVVDAYRSTALLRRLGLRERIGHVVNRWRPGAELGEVMADLGGEIVAAIPDDHGFVTAEDRHRLAAMAAGSEAGAALARLAGHIEQRARAARTAPAAPRWGSHAG